MTRLTIRSSRLAAWRLNSGVSRHKKWEISRMAAFFAFLAAVFAAVILAKLDAVHKDIKALKERDKQ